MNNLKLTMATFLSLALGYLALPGAFIFAQDRADSSSVGYADSTASDNWNEETLYDIERLRIVRWLRENNESVSDAQLSQVHQLLIEAQKFADANDFYLANIWLDTIWDLLEPPTDTETADLLDGDTAVDFGTDLYPSTETNRLNVTREVMSGVDLWRQKINFAFFESDSTLLESSGNPYSGVRFNIDYSNAGGQTFQANMSLKYSYDYFTSDIDLRFRNPVSSYLTWSLADRFETTSFFRDFDLKYIQNLTSIDMKLQPGGTFFLNLRDDLLLRRYQNENSTYPNYFNNTFYATVGLDSGLHSSLSLGYRNVNRVHGNFADHDYRENRLELNWLQFWGNLSLSVDNELRFRNYFNAPGDGIYQDYWENYLRGEIKLSFSSVFGLNVAGTFNNRNYDFINANSLPDYVYWEAEPALSFHFGSKWNVRPGVRFGRQTHQKLVNLVAASFQDDTFSIIFEDYDFIGPSIAIEFFEVNGLLFSLQESYLFRKYPHNPTRAATDFLPYSDRNINSVLLFVTWNLTAHWQLNAIANFDNEHIKNGDSGDSQSTIFGAEIGYQF